MGERNLSIVAAVLLALGGAAYLQHPNPATSPSGIEAVHLGGPTPSESPQAARCAPDVPCAAAGYFDGSSTDVNAVWYAHCASMRHLIALVPDPVAAHIGWLFDPVIEAIQRAVETNQYSLDRFAFPWDADAAEERECATGAGTGESERCGTRPAHESLPGVLLFRQSGAANSDDALAVYLVGETPTGGVHKRALDWALTRAAECSDESLRIIGPTFSGSARSLRFSVAEWWEQHWPWRARNLWWRLQRRAYDGDDKPLQSPIQVVSGTATSLPTEELAALGKDDAGAGAVDVVSFKATVLPDGYTSARFLRGYLHDELGVKPSQIALLVEANSAYGQSLRADVPVALDAPDGARDANAARERSELPPTPPNDDDMILTLPFPMHIAEARSAVEKTRGAPADTAAVPGVARPDLPLLLGDDQRPLDLPPQLHPKIALSGVESSLANLLATISRKNIQYVGLLASDMRDKVYLAQQVHKYCPDVRLFTFESDLALAHPDNRDAMSGMLVASTYPLFNRTQAWTTRKDAPRLQFSNSAAQGVYNATLVLLGYNANWLMADYAFPQAWTDEPTASDPSVYQRPVLWISTVGNGGLWPLKVYLPEKDDLEHVWAQRNLVQVHDSGVYTDRESGSARSALLIWGLLTLFCFVQVARYLAANRLGQRYRPFGRWANDAYETRPAAGQAQLAYLLLCFGTLSVIYAVWSRPFLAVPDVVPAAIAKSVVAVTLLAVAVVLIDAVSSFAPPLAGMFRYAHRLATVALLGVIFWFTAGAPGFSAFSPRGAVDAVEQRIAFERLTNLESQLSPLIPCLLVAAVWFLWGRGQLRRLALIDHEVPIVLGDESLRGQGVAAAESRVQTLIRQPYTLPVIAAAATSFLLCVLLFCALVPTFEGRQFDLCFAAGFVLASAGTVVAFSQAVALWERIRRLLDRLAAHPLAEAFARQSPRLVLRMRESLYALAPTLLDLECAADALRKLCAEFTPAVQAQLAAHLEEPADALANLGVALAQHRCDAEGDLAAAGQVEQHRDANAPARLARVHIHGAAIALVKEALTPAWNTGAAPSGAEAAAWLAQAEAFVAAQSLVHIGYLFRHIRNLLSVATAGLLLLLLTVPSYPFQPQRLFNMYISILVLAGVVAVVVSFAQMNRNELLSKLTGTPMKFDSTLLSPLLRYGALPLISLIATQFPGIGTAIFSWINPALQSMK